MLDVVTITKTKFKYLIFHSTLRCNSNILSCLCFAVTKQIFSKNTEASLVVRYQAELQHNPIIHRYHFIAYKTQNILIKTFLSSYNKHKISITSTKFLHSPSTAKSSNNHATTSNKSSSKIHTSVSHMHQTTTARSSAKMP